MTGLSKPFNWLGRHGGNEVEILVIVQHDQTVEFSASSENEVGRTWCSVSAGVDHEALHLQRAVDDSLVQRNPWHGVKVATANREMGRCSRSDQDLDYADTCDRKCSGHQGGRPSRGHSRITEAHPCRLIDQMCRHASVPRRQNRSAILGLKLTDPDQKLFTRSPFNDSA